ncbi:glycogen debranching protein GlgX [Nocardioides ferulae]|uniref:glycogen debranching protein GlgX n=1 Tax=Nocardioides ferulae TaxID=2340821 RepID=UPI001F0BE6D2|nr:glycogen debranching protein GlgX [Nocardioides ferulae]
MTPGTWRSHDDRADVWPGRHSPLGSTWGQEATNFAVWAPEATGVWVCLFDDDGHETRHRLTERTLGIWHGAIPGVAVGTRYGYRAAGPWEPAHGLRFNSAKLLMDPYARAFSGDLTVDPAIFGYDMESFDRPSALDSVGAVPFSVVVDDGFDWAGDRPPGHRWTDSVVYELHVKGMTALHDRVPEELRGSYAGLASPAVIDYLRDLGVTAVELLPVHQFLSEPSVLTRGLRNYWGYNSIGFFAPHAGYAAWGDRGQQVNEFKAMVKAFHAAGIEVILDVVYNHTAEGGPAGPTLSFRGLDDSIYQRVNPGDPNAGDAYWDVTGCGNTVDTGHPFALRMILDSLRYWATEMRVDGFRFDLLSALSRTDHRVDMRSALLTTIGQDPLLRDLKLIAEPWDASMDGYRVGEFPSPWVEWNDQFRDETRDFWLGRSAGIRTLSTRLAGSSDLYADDGRSPYASVNFITAHDGFTVRDLVSYNHKHNEANGEDNRDGTDNNRSWNHGAEGETDDAEILALRRRQAANLMATLCLSNGVPMITAGDERGRTQRGNNNAYCQDNEISWIDWSADDAWLDVYEVTKQALRLRREHPALRQRHWFEGRPAVVGGPKDVAWVHPSGREMTGEDWHDESLHTVGMFVSGAPLRAPGPRGEQLHDASFLLWLHAGPEPQRVELPGGHWNSTAEVVVSTDTRLPVGSVVEPDDHLTLGARTVVVLQQS